MGIRFTPERWTKIKADARRWWAGELERPLIHMTLWGRDPGRPEPPGPPNRRSTYYNLAVSAEQIVDRWDYELCAREFLGDAFPCVWPDLGPGVLAAFLGARPAATDRENTVWFHPPCEQEIRDIRLRAQPGNVWAERIRAIIRAAQARWQGRVQVGMSDLGGNLDVLSTFRPSEGLLLDLVDTPEEVKRVTWEEHEQWFRFFEEFNALLRPPNPGYTAWTPLFSEEPYYMLQCDFCYMLGPRMFDEFVKPELAAACRRLVNPFYHLDGKGQLPHLDSLLSIPELKGIQWVPGDGQMDCCHWPEVYRRIRAAGKLAQVLGGPECLDAVADQLGSAKGLVLITGARLDKERDIVRWMSRYGL